MFFRNLTLFRFPQNLRAALSDLQPALEAHRLNPVGPLEMFSRGFVSPFGREHEALSHALDDGVWIVLGAEDKILPSVVVNEITARKAQEIEEREGRPLGGRARKRLKEDTLHELLPRAFAKPSRTGLHLDLGCGIAAVDTSSRKTAENVISELRSALGSFPAVPVNAEVAPRSILTGWLAGEALPKGLTLGDECELKDPVDRGAVVRAQRQELTADEIGNHLDAGKQCSRLALVLDDHLSFVLGDDLVVRKLKFLDGAIERLGQDDAVDAAAELDARYALMVGELRRLFGMLESVFKLSRVD